MQNDELRNTRTAPSGEGRSNGARRSVIERAVADDLIAAIYKAEGWTPGDKAGFETRTARCSALYEITADPRRNRYVATPLSTPRSNGAGEDAVKIADSIVADVAEGCTPDIQRQAYWHVAHKAALAALSASQGEVERLRAENERLTRAVGSGMLNDLLTPDESDEFVKFIQFLRGQRNAALAQPEAGGE